MNPTARQIEALRRAWGRHQEVRRRELVLADWDTVQAAWDWVEASGQAVLDLGCSDGLVTTLLANRQPGHRFVGVDIEAAAIQRAWRQGQAQGLHNVTFVQGDAKRLPFASGTFDVVWARFLLQHVQRPEQVVREGLRVLRPGGRLLLWDWDDGLVVCYPGAPCLTRLFALRTAYARSRGADTAIGRHLFHLLKTQGPTDVRARVISWNSTWPGRTWLRTFLGLEVAPGSHSPLVREGLVSVTEYRRLLAQCRTFVESPDTFVSTGSFVAVGPKETHPVV